MLASPSKLGALVRRKVGRWAHGTRELDWLLWMYCDGAGARRFPILMKHLRATPGMVITGSSLMRFMHPSMFPTWKPGDVDIFVLDTRRDPTTNCTDRSCDMRGEIASLDISSKWTCQSDPLYDAFGPENGPVKFIASYKTRAEVADFQTEDNRGLFELNIVRLSVCTQSDEFDVFGALQKHCLKTFNPREAAWMFDGFRFYPPTTKIPFTLHYDALPTIHRCAHDGITSFTNLKTAIEHHLRFGKTVKEWNTHSLELYQHARRTVKTFVLPKQSGPHCFLVNDNHVTQVWPDGSFDAQPEEWPLWPNLNGIVIKMPLSEFCMRVQEWAASPIQSLVFLRRFLERLQTYVRRGYVVKLEPINIVLKEL